MRALLKDRVQCVGRVVFLFCMSKYGILHVNITQNSPRMFWFDLWNLQLPRPTKHFRMPVETTWRITNARKSWSGRCPRPPSWRKGAHCRFPKNIISCIGISDFQSMSQSLYLSRSIHYTILHWSTLDRTPREDATSAIAGPVKHGCAPMYGKWSLCSSIEDAL